MTSSDTTTVDQVRAMVLRLVAAMAIEPPTRPLVGKDRLIDDLGFDSVRLIELTMALERVFHLRAHQPEQLVAISNVDHVVDLINSALATEGRP